MNSQIVLSVILGGALLFFIWGRWRHDVVAFLALMIAVVLGVVGFDQAFSGFAHPAVITVPPCSSSAAPCSFPVPST